MIKKILLGMVSTGFMVMLFMVPTLAAAEFDPLEKACSSAVDSAVCEENKLDVDPLTGENGILTRAAGLLANVVAIIAVIVIVVAGLTMTLSSGDASKVKSSRDAIIYAAVGLAVAGLAKAIVIFVTSKTA